MTARSPLFASVLVALFACAIPARAHDITCEHTHVHWFRVHCNPDFAECEQNGKPGRCITRKKAGLIPTWDCHCITSDAGSNVLVGGVIEVKLDALPAEDAVVCGGILDSSTVVALTLGEPEESLRPARGSFVGGSMRLRFGSFADPRRVPVELLDSSLSLDGAAAGAGVDSLRSAPGAQLLGTYDQLTGVIETAGGAPFRMALDSSADPDAPSVLILGGVINPASGLLRYELQLVQDVPEARSARRYSRDIDWD